MKVLAIEDGFFNNSFVPKGSKFYIKERKGKRRINPYSNYTEEFIVTVEKQFSKYWMIELDEEENQIKDQAHNDAVADARASAEKIRIKTTQNTGQVLDEEPVITKQKVKRVRKNKVAAVEVPVDDEEVI